jgi:hypothetical protein
LAGLRRARADRGCALGQTVQLSRRAFDRIEPLLIYTRRYASPLACRTQGRKPQTEIDRTRASSLGQEGIAFREQRTEIGRRLPFIRRSTEQHDPKSGMDWELGQGASQRCDRAAPVERAEPVQEVECLVPGRRGWGVDPAQRLRILDTPDRQLQRQRREIGFEDLRCAPIGSSDLLGPGPESPADTRGQTPSTSGTLIGAGAWDGLGHQPGQTRAWVKAWLACQARVEHHPDALDGQAGLGQIRGQDQTPPSTTVRAQRSILLRRRQRAMQRQDLEVRPRNSGQGLTCPFDLRRTGQEGQDVARLLHQRLTRRRDQGVHRISVRGALGIADLDRKGPTLGMQDRGVAQELCNGFGLQGRRHDQETQIGSQTAHAVQRQREPQIRVQTALMELVEDHQPDPVQCRIALQTSRQDALGDDLDPGARTEATLEADLIADPFPQGLAESFSHPCRRHPGRWTARLEHQDPLTGQPGFVQQGQGYAGRLA